MFDITKYCGVDDPRQFINKPFNLFNKTVATDGHILICIPLQDEYSELTNGKIKPEFIEGWISQIEAAELQPAPPISLPKKHTCKDCDGEGKSSNEDCEECDGEGEVAASTDYNIYYDLQCKSCDGLGYIKIKGDKTCANCSGTGTQYDFSSTVQIFGYHFNPKYIELILENNPMVAIAKNEEDLLFKFDDAVGVLRGMRVKNDMKATKENAK